MPATDDMTIAVTLVTCFLLATQSFRFATATPQFHQGQIMGYVDSAQVTEASGLAYSRRHPQVLYTHNDRGDTNRLFAISATDAKVKAILTIGGAAAVDWEDIAVGPCSNGSSVSCIYIADTGDGGPGPARKVYRVIEPATITDQTVQVDSQLQFSWSEVDVETLMVDPRAELYIISKVEGARGRVGRIPSSGWGSSQIVQVVSGNLMSNTIVTTKKGPVGGDISPDGNEVLVKLKLKVYYWNMNGGSDYLTVLTQAPHAELPYTLETRGESVCWNSTGTGYYTLGEGVNQPLYFYAKK